ncbi:MAG: hypothetical protein M1158_02050 [Candidatus Marsarchaeota archaeon]|jgi:type II secretory pathway component PulM|nr:hypothetical protein [Candidatus Marsarchaeota archaeon]
MVQNEQTDQPQQQKRRNRKLVYVIAGVAIAIVIVTYLLTYTPPLPVIKQTRSLNQTRPIEVISNDTTYS